MNNLELSQEEINEICYTHISKRDKWYRMFAGLSSTLVKVEDGIIYLRIVNNKTKILSTYNTAVNFAVSWKNENSKLQNATGFVVVFRSTNTPQGTALSANQPLDLIAKKLKKVLQDIDNDQPELESVFSGEFRDDLEYLSKDLVNELG